MLTNKMEEKMSISDLYFEKIFKDENFSLPKKRKEKDFLKELKNLFNEYIKKLIKDQKEVLKDENSFAFFCDVKNVTDLLIESVDNYLNGFPAKALESFNLVMKIVEKYPLHRYEKDDKEQIIFFRAVYVNDENISYDRTRVFHTPYDLRSKVSTSRFSIAGYPSLYLSTSLELCCEEIKCNEKNDRIIASAFKIRRKNDNQRIKIQVVELGIKPQDFFDLDNTNGNKRLKRVRQVLEQKITKSNYLIWYPLIAACSFIRKEKEDPFAVEYIIPQLLMQWLRNEINKKEKIGTELIVIRYFSCASFEASNMGLNYVFPTSRVSKFKYYPYCGMLARTFCLTKPVYIDEYESVLKCEEELTKFDDKEYLHIDENLKLNKDEIPLFMEHS